MDPYRQSPYDDEKGRPPYNHPQFYSTQSPSFLPLADSSSWPRTDLSELPASAASLYHPHLSQNHLSYLPPEQYPQYNPHPVPPVPGFSHQPRSRDQLVSNRAKWNQSPTSVPTSENSLNQDQQTTQLPSFHSVVEEIARNPHPETPWPSELVSNSRHMRTFPPLYFGPYRTGSSPPVTSSDPSLHHYMPAASSMPPFPPTLLLQQPLHPAVLSLGLQTAHRSSTPRVLSPQSSHSRHTSESRHRGYYKSPPLSLPRSLLDPTLLPASVQTMSSYMSATPSPVESYNTEGVTSQQHIPYAQQHIEKIGFAENRNTQIPMASGEMQLRADTGLEVGKQGAPAQEQSLQSPTFVPNGVSGFTPRRRRGNLPKNATRTLRQWFDDHSDAPYPSEEVKSYLCQATGLHISQVNNWFINARRRLPRTEDARRPIERRGSSEASDETPVP